MIMIRWSLHRLILPVTAIVFLSTLSFYASAEIIDDIKVHTRKNGDVDTIIKFSVPIQYQRHYPKRKSASTSIYFNILGGASVADWQNYESHRSPPSDLIQDILVSTRDRGTGPKIHIKFYRPVMFSVRMGKSNQVLLIHITPGMPQQKNDSKPVSIKSNGVPVPIAVLPNIAKTPSVSAPPVAVPTVSPDSTKTKAAPVATVPVAAPPTAPVVPSGDVTAPKVALAPSRFKPVYLPLGRKDGLPDYPELDQGTPKVAAAPNEKLSLADQIVNTNLQAAALMEKAGRAILAGQAVTAIETFNKVLELPPNKYSQDAQLWIGIARERSGQLSKAILEFNAYLKIYPDGKSARWVRIRLGRLKAAQPALFRDTARPSVTPVKVQNTKFQFSEFGSISTYYYYGQNWINTTTTSGTVQSSTTITRNDQNSLMTNINMSARAFNNEYDNRLVFQDFHSWNFLPGQDNSDRLGAAYYELKDRIVNYSFKVGRQSGYGGGVMGRFFGIAAGYGFAENWKANVVMGQLVDYSLDEQPKFNGVSLDFGTRSPLGGSVYFIDQTVSGFTDRRAVGGNLRYFDQGFNIMSMLDYDVQFKALNIVTVQGTVNDVVSGTDFNFLVDRRRSPILDVRNAVNGTSVSIASMIENGFTTEDLIGFAKQRTTASNNAQVGMTNRLNEKWNIGTDFSISNTSGLPRSGGDTSVTCDVSNQSFIPTEGCVDATSSSGNTWTVSERATGMGLFMVGDITNFSLSYTKGPTTSAEAFQVNNHADLQEKLTFDTALTMSRQRSTTGTSYDVSPSVRAGYRIRNNLTVDGQLGLDWNNNSSSSLERGFFSLGGRFDF
jgi:hypothetical protein